jgi:hypothetical protein
MTDQVYQPVFTRLYKRTASMPEKSWGGLASPQAQKLISLFP